MPSNKIKANLRPGEETTAIESTRLKRMIVRIEY
jgi:hypothetical protein